MAFNGLTLRRGVEKVDFWNCSWDSSMLKPFTLFAKGRDTILLLLSCGLVNNKNRITYYSWICRQSLYNCRQYCFGLLGLISSVLKSGMKVKLKKLYYTTIPQRGGEYIPRREASRYISTALQLTSISVCPLDDAPFNIVPCVAVLLFRDVFWKNRGMGVGSVIEREFVVVVSGFEIVFCHADVSVLLFFATISAS